MSKPLSEEQWITVIAMLTGSEPHEVKAALAKVRAKEKAADDPDPVAAEVERLYPDLADWYALTNAERASVIATIERGESVKPGR